MKKLMQVLQYAAPYKWQAIFNILFNLLSIVFSLFSLTMLIPFLDLIFLKTDANHAEVLAKGAPQFALSAQAMQDFFNYQMAQFIISDPNGGRANALLWVCFAIVGMIFFKNLFRYLALYVMADLRNGVLKDLRNELFNRLIILPKSYFSEERKGDILSRFSTDVKEIEWTILRSIEMLFRDPANLIIFLVALLLMSTKLTLFVFIMLPIATFIIGSLGRSLRRTSAKGQEKIGTLTVLLEEMLSGLTIIKAFNAQEFIKSRFEVESNRYKNIMTRLYRKNDLSSPLSEFLGVFILVVIIWFGGKLVLSASDGLTASTFIAYIAIFSQIIPPAKSFTTAYYNLQKGAAAVERINEILNAEEKIVNHPNAISKRGFDHSINFEKVNFSYGNEKVLSNISFSINKGEKVALVGASGSGKTTIANLLPRFYDIQSGVISIDKVPIDQIEVLSLRSMFGFVTQQPILFNDTIANNIAFGAKQFSMDEVINAAKVANAHDFIVSLPLGYETNIGDSGDKLSGGQRQRISIARAVFKNPQILILDEATSALDTESEKLVQDALNKLMQDRTALIIAHRLSTVKHADKILVLEKGQVVEQGTHLSLIESRGVYYKLNEIQTLV